MSKISYDRVHVKEGLRPEEYGWRQRRADLWRRIRAEGGAHNLNKSHLAHDVYDVARSTLYDDLDALSEWASESLNDREALDGEALFARTLRNLQADADALRNQGNHAKAASVEKDAVKVFRWASEWRAVSDLEELLERVEALERKRDTSDYQLK
jgi:hypothetical protein